MFLTKQGVRRVGVGGGWGVGKADLEADLAITVQVQHVKALLGLGLVQEVLHILQQHMIPAANRMSQEHCFKQRKRRST